MHITRSASLFAFALALAGAPHARAQTPASVRTYDVQVTTKVNGQDLTQDLHPQENQPFTVSGSAGDKPWQAEFVLNRVYDANANGAKATVRLSGTITGDGQTLAKPTLMGGLGERMGIKIGTQPGEEVQLAFVVKDRAP